MRLMFVHPAGSECQPIRPRRPLPRPGHVRVGPGGLGPLARVRRGLGVDVEIGPKGDRTAAAPGRRPTVTRSVAGSV